MCVFVGICQEAKTQRIGCDVGNFSTVSWVLTCRFQELLGWPEDDVAVPVRAEEQPHQGSAVCHADLHVFVQEPLEFLSGPGRGGQERGLLKFTQEGNWITELRNTFYTLWIGFCLSTQYQRMYQPWLPKWLFIEEICFSVCVKSDTVPVLTPDLPVKGLQ